MRRKCRERFPRIQRKPLVSEPGMHHGTCFTHVPWCMSGLLTRGGRENDLGIPGACATCNFTYLARGLWCAPSLSWWGDWALMNTIVQVENTRRIKFSYYYGSRVYPKSNHTIRALLCFVVLFTVVMTLVMAVYMPQDKVRYCRSLWWGTPGTNMD